MTGSESASSSDMPRHATIIYCVGEEVSSTYITYACI